VLVRLLTEERARLVTLVGPGGIGKTRLALHMAHELAGRFTEGALFVPMAALASAADLPAAVARAMQAPTPSPGEPLVQLEALLAGKSLLLVLDNVEHLLVLDQADETIGLIHELAGLSAGVHLLLTSRERLRVGGERIFELGGLAVNSQDPTQEEAGEQPQSDAVQLFVQRARQVSPGFDLTPANRAAAVRLCTLLDGMPLGIELAAAWVRTLTPEEIVGEMGRSLDFLALADRTAPARHRSLRAVFDHSWKLTTPEEQRVLAPLAVFRGGFDRAAAQAVAGATLPLLATLIDKSFVRVVTNVLGSEHGQRYYIHGLLRQYLLDRLPETTREAAQAINPAVSAEDAVRRQHAQYFAELMARLEPASLIEEPLPWRQQVAGELGNLRAALTWCVTERKDLALGLRLAASLGRYWSAAHAWKEGRDWLCAALAQPAGDEAARTLALIRLGELYHLLADYGTAEATLQEGLALARSQENMPKIAWALFELGKVTSTRGNYERGERYLSESLVLYRQVGDQRGVVALLSQLSSIEIQRSDYRRAAAYLDEALPIIQKLQRKTATAISTNLLGRALLGQGETDRAIALFHQALDIFHAQDAQSGIAWTLLNLGLAQLQAGAPAAATAEFQECVRVYQELESYGGMLAALWGLAAAVCAQGQHERAVRLLAAAEQLHGAGGQMPSNYELEMHQQTIDLTKAALDERAWQAAWAAGTNRPVEETIAVAVETPPVAAT
jgi:predicted ATPase